MKKYNIGLDIGTSSVGWAVVEANTQKIIRKGKDENRKSLWGVRLFEEAKTAAGRRGFRSIRRRYDRRRERIRLLQEEFKEEINKVDSQFYQKLKESKYQKNDCENKTIKITQKEIDQIKEYNEKYPTIYHLRKELVENTEKKDIRLVYLAIHHIIKYRGNFLYNTENFDIENLNLQGKLKEFFNSLGTEIPELNISEEMIEHINYFNLENILLNDSKNDIKTKLNEELKNVTDNSKFSKNLGLMIVGNQFNIAHLFILEVSPEEEKILKINFSDSTYDENYDQIEKILGDKIICLETLKELYDMIFLKKLFKGQNYQNLSSLMVDKYEKHKEDLALLKQILKQDRKIYNKIFRTTDKNLTHKEYTCIYDKYIHNQITYDEFKKEIDKYIPNFLEHITDEKAKYRIENEEFLPRITNTDNGQFPYQLNKAELKKIIENQGKHYPFLLDKIEGEYKIIKLLTFRIPYYVGPLVSKDKSRNAWMIRKVENVKITPYNFEYVVNKEATAEEFITRMISHCTYLLKEKALPNNSILYSKYKVLNELKQIKINNEKIIPEIQLEILENLFMKTPGTITEKKFKDYIYSSKNFSMFDSDITITGYSAEGKFANNMQPYIDFFSEDGIFKGTSYTEDNAEEIIRWITIFEDKDILKDKVKKAYRLLSEDKINQILSKQYKGWGRLSSKLLTTKYYIDKESGIKKSIMDLLNETEYNFMQILNKDEYGFQKMIQQENNIPETEKKLNYNIVKELATSPATKRGIYQSLKVVEELIDYMGTKPEKIIIEMARENGEKKRKDDRKKKIELLYNNSKEQILEFNKLKNELNTIDKIDSEKLFLYFIQEGKCLYSGQPLNIENLNSYEVDHILPRSIIKDDSIDNKALVYRECNQEKRDNLVLPSKFRNNDMIKFWKHLKDIKLISATKFYRLTRKEYKDEDIENFINRQLVETRQITKHVANIISNLYDTKVIYLKANLSHTYREKYELFKFRELNDFHHAFDAYLAAVLGEYKENYIKPNKISYEVIKQLNDIIKERKEYNQLRYGFVINSLDQEFNNIVNDITHNITDNQTGEILFDAEEFNKRIEATYYRNDILISKKTEIKNGEFYNQTKNKKGNVGVALKKNMPTEIYGSYTSLNPSYAIVVRYSKNNQEEQRIIGIPTYIDKINDIKIKDQYIRKLLSLNNKEDYYGFVSNKIPFYSEINWNNQICSLVGANDKVEVCNAKEFFLDKATMIKLKSTLNRLLNKRGNINDDEYLENINILLNIIYEKIKSIYSLYTNLSEELHNIINDNKECSTENKEQLIIQLLNLLKCNSKCANFKFLNEKYSSAFGKKHSRIIEHAIIKHKSVTGLKETTYEF